MATKDFTIRKAHPEEADKLSTLALLSKGYWGYDAEFLQQCEEELTVHKQQIMHYPSFVLEHLGEILGFYIMEPLNGLELDLDFFFIHPDKIGKGYGTLLMNHAKQTATSLGYASIWVQSDPHAAAFYQKMGGQRIGEVSSRSIPGRRLPVFKIKLSQGRPHRYSSN